MINHSKFYRILEKKGGTLTLSSNYQPSIEDFSIAEVGKECSESEILKGARREKASRVGVKGWGGASTQHRSRH